MSMVPIRMQKVDSISEESPNSPEKFPTYRDSKLSVDD
jgi:hypothetical protein